MNKAVPKKSTTENQSMKRSWVKMRKKMIPKKLDIQGTILTQNRTYHDAKKKKKSNKQKKMKSRKK